jgi:DNA polymerase
MNASESDLPRLLRLVRQSAAAWQSAGVADLPEASPAIKAMRVQKTRKAPATPESRPAAPAAAAATAAPLVGLEPAGTSSMPREQRAAALADLAKQVASCTRCPDLARTRKQTVFGVGNPQARVLFLGEAPGYDEDQQGEPFVGRAGQLLNKIIEATGLRREEIYICNILRCRPPDNRTPLPEEAAHCREWLDGQLRIIDPEYIVCWGSCAAQNLLATSASIGSMRGKWYRHGRAKVLCTYHPSYLLRNPPAKKFVWEDMQILMRELGLPLPGK